MSSVCASFLWDRCWGARGSISFPQLRVFVLSLEFYLETVCQLTAEGEKALFE